MVAAELDNSAVGYVVAGAIAAVAALFSQQAAKRSKANRQSMQVPDDGSPTATRDPGPVLHGLEESMRGLRGDVQDAKSAADTASVAARLAAEEARTGHIKINAKVEDIKVSMAEHRGEHKGFQRDLDRLTQKVFNGDKA